MASILNQLQNSVLSLQGNGFNPQRDITGTNPSWWYSSGPAVSPANSELHYENPGALGYSTDNSPTMRINDFNRAALGGVSSVRPASELDETDPNAPNNFQAGLPGSVVSLIYKSTPGQQYKQLGPPNGRY